MRYLRVGEVAELLQVDRTTVWRWVKSGRFGEIKQGGFGKTSPHKIPLDVVLEVADGFGIEVDEEIRKGVD